MTTKMRRTECMQILPSPALYLTNHDDLELTFTDVKVPIYISSSLSLQ
ncbi:hypothetical protein BDE02_01G405400 [Populus trichocarpa]|nr:hypothetical protein BDE02_01G405400 [Populus trichocarpa]